MSQERSPEGDHRCPGVGGVRLPAATGRWCGRPSPEVGEDEVSLNEIWPAGPQRLTEAGGHFLSDKGRLFLKRNPPDWLMGSGLRPAGGQSTGAWKKNK